MWPCCVRISLCHGSSSFFENFCRILVKTLSIMASMRNEYSLHNYAYRYFVLITDSHAHISCFAIALSFLSSVSTFGRLHCACATAYLMCLRCFIHTNYISVGKPPPPLICITIRYIFHFVPWDHLSI